MTKSELLRKIEWVRVPAGEFLYGEAKEPRSLEAFEIMKCPVTVGQYRAFCVETGRDMPPAPGWELEEDHPIVNVTWFDAAAFADWAGLALPGEAQWEKAARGTDGRAYPWGDEWDATKCRNSVDGRAEHTSPVGAYPNGASPYDVLDMSGNVWEWCADWYNDEKKERVLRGGGWATVVAANIRVFFRGYNDPAGRFQGDFGFRCAR